MEVSDRENSKVLEVGDRAGGNSEKREETLRNDIAQAIEGFLNGTFTVAMTEAIVSGYLNQFDEICNEEPEQ